LHDIGKFNADFQEYLQRCWEAEQSEGKPPKSKSPHSIYGALIAWQLGLEILAFCLEGHHGGLSNLADLKSRLVNPTDGQRNTLAKIKDYVNMPPQSGGLFTFVSRTVVDIFALF